MKHKKLSVVILAVAITMGIQQSIYAAPSPSPGASATEVTQTATSPAVTTTDEGTPTITTDTTTETSETEVVMSNETAESTETTKTVAKTGPIDYSKLTDKSKKTGLYLRIGYYAMNMDYISLGKDAVPHDITFTLSKNGKELETTTLADQEWQAVDWLVKFKHSDYKLGDEYSLAIKNIPENITVLIGDRQM